MAEEQPTAPPSAEELRQWYTPSEALRRATVHLGEQFAPEGIWNRIRAGIIRMASHSASEQKDSDLITPYRTPQVLPSSLFRTHRTLPDKFWSGDFLFLYEEPPPEAKDMNLAEVMADPELRYKFKNVYIEAFGVRLNKEDVDREFPVQPAVPTVEEISPPAKHAGGAKPKPWWDDFWIEMVCRQHAGDIQPTTAQADVARLMLRWATRKGHDMGDTTAKTMARRLLAALKAEDKN